MSRRDDIKKLIINHSRRLQKLKEQQSLLGISVAPNVLIQIEDLEATIKKLQVELASLPESSPIVDDVAPGDVHSPGEPQSTQEKSAGGVSISVSGNVEGSQIFGAAGDLIIKNAHVTMQAGSSLDELTRAFAEIYRQIEARSDDPDVDREEIKETVEKIEAEIKKGDEASASKVERWLGFLSQMAPDILEVTAATLTSPIAGVAAIIRNVAKKATNLPDEKTNTN